MKDAEKGGGKDGNPAKTTEWERCGVWKPTRYTYYRAAVVYRLAY